MMIKIIYAPITNYYPIIQNIRNNFTLNLFTNFKSLTKFTSIFEYPIDRKIRKIRSNFLPPIFMISYLLSDR